ncbi:MAG: YfiR/HmsC family protein [Lacunisphaera sp.]
MNPPAPFPVERSSGLIGHSSGAELTLEWQATPAWRVFAGYTELRVHSEPQPGNMDLTSDRNIARDPNHQLILRSLFNLSSRWELDPTVRYVGQISNDQVPAYIEADLHLGWHPAPRVDVFRGGTEPPARPPRRVQRPEWAARNRPQRLRPRAHGVSNRALIRRDPARGKRTAPAGSARSCWPSCWPGRRLRPRRRLRRPSPEYQVKAVFLFNFAQFVDWPDQTFSDAGAPLVIGVLGDDPFGAYLDELVRNEKIGKHPLAVRRFGRVQDITECHILFVSRAEAGQFDRIAAELKDRSLLTVGDTDSFKPHGGMVRFVMENGKIRLRINVESAKACGLTISSKLLRWATIVTQEKG